MKNFKFSLLAIVALVASFAISSCTKDAPTESKKPDNTNNVSIDITVGDATPSGANIVVKTKGIKEFAYIVDKDVEASAILAGGIKTTTAAVLFVATWSTIKGMDYTGVFKRKLNPATVRKALSVTIISFSAALMALILMLTFCKGDFMDLSFEVFSAIGTVGLTRGVTSSLNAIGQIIIIVCMYLGRTGPISLVIALNHIKGRQTGKIAYPEESITVG